MPHTDGMFTRYGLLIEAAALAGAAALLCAPLFAEAPQDSVRDRLARHWESVLPRKEPEVRAMILFGGDMMFDRAIRLRGEQRGDDFLLTCIDPVFADADRIVANLEGPVTSASSVSVGSIVETSENYTFTVPTTTPALLSRHGSWLVSIGNNHVLNFGWKGLAETRRWLDASSIPYFGDPESNNSYRTSIQGVSLAFIGYNQFAPRMADGSRSEDAALAQVAAARAEGFVPIVYAHWGDEYMPANDAQKVLAHKFVDAGAAFVVGSHPHVAQEHEEYRGAHIYYSLGNMIFDQWWDANVSTGLLLRVSFGKGGVQGIEEIPVKMQRDGATCVLQKAT